MVQRSTRTQGNGFYSYDDSKDVWFNNGGGNYHAQTTDVTGA
jgi:hypothetical protein